MVGPFVVCCPRGQSALYRPVFSPHLNYWRARLRSSQRHYVGQHWLNPFRLRALFAVTNARYRLGQLAIWCGISVGARAYSAGGRYCDFCCHRASHQTSDPSSPCRGSRGYKCCLFRRSDRLASLDTSEMQSLTIAMAMISVFLLPLFSPRVRDWSTDPATIDHVNSQDP